ncbi:MAG: ATP-binding protein [Actinomycetota bacterium]|nr:ATP-binding protein [Actinomycetota bacterium]
MHRPPAATTGPKGHLLAGYGLPDDAPEEQLRAVTRVAATVCRVPTAVVNLLDECFQHQVGSVGFSGDRSEVADSMCALALRDDRLRHVPDAAVEPAFAGNPWVDGRLARVRLYASAPMRLPDGQVLGSLCVFDEQPGRLTAAQLSALEDLAAQAVALFEQGRLAREAERRGALTAALLETIDVGVVACDADGRLTLFNRASRDFHGLAEDSRLDPGEWASTYSLFEADGTTPMAADRIPLTRALREGEVQDATLVLRPPHREPLTVRCDGAAMHDGSGRLLGAVVAMKDVTGERSAARELAAARDEALAATRAKTAFLAAASHEIRTPLNGVLGMLEALALGDLTAGQAEYVALARSSGEALLSLLNDVLDLSKAETTSVTLARRPFRAGEVAAEVVAALRPVAERKGLALALNTDGDDQLLGDPLRLRQVVMNLLGNALKFTASGRVSVSVRTDRAPDGAEARLRLAVQDTGAGMEADEIDRLFRPFVQGKGGARHGGTGLGLALSQQLVQLMGGRIDVVSAPGRGSLFTVLVDLRLADEDADDRPAPVERYASPAPADDAVRGTGLRVLVADDNEVNLRVAEALLRAEGAQVVTVPDGDDAVRALTEEPFDLVLLDMQMPRLSGPAAARAIRALPGPASRTPLLALTAASAEEDRAACLAAGMQGVLLKPVRRADLGAVLAGLAR